MAKKIVEVPDELLKEIVDKLMQAGLKFNEHLKGMDAETAFYSEDLSWVTLAILIDKLRGIIEVHKE